MSAIPLDFASSAFATLLVTMDPAGIAPIFIGVTAGMTVAQRRETAIRATIIALIVLIAAAFFGRPLLAALGISLDAFRIAGGLLLGVIAFEMVFEKRNERKQNAATTAVTKDDIQNIAAFPLAVPLTAGPGAITAAILLHGEAGGDPIRIAVVIGAIVVVAGLCLAAFLLASPIDRIMGITGRVVLTRLLGVILAALSIQFVIDGVKGVLANTG